MTMSLRKLCLGIMLCPLAGIAGAAPLTVVNVSAPDINCVFETDCSVVVTDSVGNIALPNVDGHGPAAKPYICRTARRPRRRKDRL